MGGGGLPYELWGRFRVVWVRDLIKTVVCCLGGSWLEWRSDLSEGSFKGWASLSKCPPWGSFRLEDCRFNDLLLFCQIAINVLCYKQSVKLSAHQQMVPNVSWAAGYAVVEHLSTIQDVVFYMGHLPHYRVIWPNVYMKEFSTLAKI